MTDTIIELSEDEFDAQYPLRTNHLNPSAGWAYGEGAGFLFETYGEELTFVRQQDPRTVWTFIDGDDGDQYLLSGFHLVNRIGYLISTVPVPEGTTIEVRIPMQSEEDAVAKAHTPEPWSCGGRTTLYATPDESGEMTMIEVNANVTEAGWDTVAFIEAIWPGAHANARRIVAAVNACAGIPTEALEQGTVGELLQALKGCLFALDKNQDGSGPSKAQAIAAAITVIAKATGGSDLRH